MKINNVVVFTGKSNSWDTDDSLGNMYMSEGLAIGEKYVVSNYSEGDWSTHIQLIGFGDRWYSLSLFKEENE